MAIKQLGVAPAAASVETARMTDVAALISSFGALSGPAFFAYRASSDHSLTSNVASKISLNAEVFDSGALFDSSSNFRFQPNVAGYYHFDFRAQISAGSGNLSGATALLYKNGGEVARGTQLGQAVSDAAVAGCGGGAVVYLNGSTDYVELWGYGVVASGTVVATQGITLTYMSGNLVKADSWIDLANSASVIVDIFTSSGTWTKPAGAQWVNVLLHGGGGSGGAGRKGAASSARSGGAGGGGGGRSEASYPASVLGSTETVTVGAAVSGAARQTTNSTNGAAGTAGNPSSFGNWLKANGGAAGAGGGTGAATGGAGGTGLISPGGAGASTPATPGAGVAGSVSDYGSSGGGCGGGIPTGNTANVGGAGGGAPNFYNGTLAGGTAGTSPGGNGGNGNSSAVYIGTGGGGGGSSITGQAGNGGLGVGYGGGGGGGGAGLDSTGDSGAGGNGAGGIAVVTTMRGNVGATSTQVLAISVGDETTAITAGTNKIKFRIPFANGFKLTGIGASLTVAQTSGSIFTVDVNEAGTTLMATSKITIDNGETMSLSGAATPPVLTDTVLAAYAEISVDVDAIGDGTAKGLKVYLLGYPL